MVAMDVVLPQNIPLKVEELVRFYVQVKPRLKYADICTLINEHHGLALTMRQLKELCRKIGHTRRRNVDDMTLRDVLLHEIGFVQNVGYRQMTEMISLKYNINVSREDVRKMLVQVDPAGVKSRRNETIKRRIYLTDGPMDVLHMDGNDKLKRFGFALHGCIDGFSRKLLWLVAATTNNDPLVIANFYIDFVSRIGTAPNTLRMDLGTENVYCEELQKFLTKRNDSFLYAGSTRSQRIESFWSRLKKFKLSWWIDFFNDMVKVRLHKPACPLHKEVLIFSFMPVIQAQLNECVRMWNTRNIRQSAQAPGGVPEMLFNVPSTVGFQKQGYTIDASDIVAARSVIGIDHHPINLDSNLYELLLCYVQIHNLEIPRDPDSALNFYVELLELLENDGFSI